MRIALYIVKILQEVGPVALHAAPEHHLGGPEAFAKEYNDVLASLSLFQPGDPNLQNLFLTDSFGIAM